MMTSPKQKDLKYILYVRKSTDSEDKQMASIEDQTSEMMRLAENLDLNVIETITESKSAKTPSGRPEFNKMLGRIQKGEANGILCWKINRLARNPVDGGQISWMLQEGTIQHLQTYSREYNPWDNVLMMAVELGMSTQYVNDLSVDVKRSQRNKAKRGWYPASVLPMGYKHKKDYNMGDQEIEKDAERFKIVKSLWKKMLTGSYSIPDIKREADSLGLRNRSGKPYSVNTFYNTFTHPFYFGVFDWNGEEGYKERFFGKHEALITEDEFNRVQTLLGKHGRPTKVNKYDFPFRSSLSCGECGCAVTAERKLQAICTQCKKKFSIRTQTECPACHIDVSEMERPSIIDKTYYRCTKKKGVCSQRYIEESVLENQISESIKKVSIPTEFYAWAVEALKYIHRNEIHEQDHITQQNRKRETELLNKLDNLVMMRASDEITSEQLLKTRAQVEKELRVVRKNVEGLHERAIDWVGVANNYLNFAQNAREKFKNGDNNTKREVLSILGSNLTLKDKKLNVSVPSPLSGIRSTYDLSVSLNATLEPKIPQLKQGYSGELDATNSSLLSD
ncbi:recombinase family protein [Candidatus Kaiserbacteria bacterium]|nr:MAG: recombinase family protein [Candidatus Kaiserbacteria bacterium]